MKHIDQKQLEPAPMPDGTATLESVIEQVQTAPGLSDGRRRDMVSGLRRVASALGRDPADIPALPRWLQPRLADVMPAALGATDKTWQNAVSAARSALAHVGIVTRRNRHVDDLGAPWRDLWRAVVVSRDKSLTIGLGRFVHFLSARDIAPNEVTQIHADAFHDALLADEIAKSPDWAWKNAIWGWNLAIDRIPDWPQKRLIPPNRKKVIKLPDEALPPAFLDDLAQLMQRLAHPDPFAEEDPIRALRPTTIKQQTSMLKRFASELLQAGVPAGEIDSVAALCDPARAERGLRAMVARNNGKPNAVIANMASMLRNHARRLDLGDKVIALLSKQAQRLTPSQQPGLTAKNRERLRPLQDNATLRRLLDLPKMLIRKAARLTPRHAALAREDALAIAILLTCPMRIKNLAGLRADREVQRPGGGLVFVAIDADDVKNERRIEFELPPDLRRMLDRHLATRAPLLCPPGTPWLFPRRDGRGPVDLPAFSTRLSKRIRKEIGLAMNPHLFRHLAAMIWLRANPGSYEVARRLLGHSSVSTTMDFYTAFETDAALQAFSEVIAGKRKGK